MERWEPTLPFVLLRCHHQPCLYEEELISFIYKGVDEEDTSVRKLVEFLDDDGNAEVDVCSVQISIDECLETVAAMEEGFGHQAFGP